MEFVNNMIGKYVIVLCDLTKNDYGGAIIKQLAERIGKK